MSKTAVPGSDFVDLGQVRERLGVARSTLQRRMNRAGLEIFIDPADERARLVRARDVEILLQPRPVAPMRKHDPPGCKPHLDDEGAP